MPRLYLTKDQKRKLVTKYSLSKTTLFEIVRMKRPYCKRHAEIQNYAINELGARLIDD